MHDFLLAKQIVDELKRIAEERNLENITAVSLEIGSISMAHDGHPEHLEEIDPDNLRFGLESLAKDGPLKGARFNISKVPGSDWKITDLEVK